MIKKNALIAVSLFTILLLGMFQALLIYGMVPPHPPVASFSISPPPPNYVGDLLSFNGSSSSPGWTGNATVPIVDYEWNFGDGNVTHTAGPTVTHSYSAAANYNVTLVVTDAYGTASLPAIEVVTIYGRTQVSVSPENNIFYTNTTSVGSEFNVTVCVANVTDLLQFSVQMLFNSTMLNCTGAWQPYWDSQYVFYGRYSFRPPPTISAGSVTVSATTINVTTFSGTGKLCIIELQIIQAPPTGGNLSCTLDITNTSLKNSIYEPINTNITPSVYAYYSGGPKKDWIFWPNRGAQAGSWDDSDNWRIGDLNEQPDPSKLPTATEFFKKGALPNKDDDVIIFAEKTAHHGGGALITLKSFTMQKGSQLDQLGKINQWVIHTSGNIVIQDNAVITGYCVVLWATSGEGGSITVGSGAKIVANRRNAGAQYTFQGVDVEATKDVVVGNSAQIIACPAGAIAASAAGDGVKITSTKGKVVIGSSAVIEAGDGADATKAGVHGTKGGPVLIQAGAGNMVKIQAKAIVLGGNGGNADVKGSLAGDGGDLTVKGATVDVSETAIVLPGSGGWGFGTTSHGARIVGKEGKKNIIGKLVGKDDSDGSVVTLASYSYVNMTSLQEAAINATESIIVTTGPNGTIDLRGNPAGTPVLVANKSISLDAAHILLDPGVSVADITQPAATVGPPTMIDVPLDFSSIQEAINNAAPGDIILVDSGTYYEHVTVNKSLTLIGEGPDTTIIDGNGTGTVMNVTADNVSIEDFAIQNGYYGILLNNVNNATLSDNNMTNNRFNLKVKGTSLSNFLPDIDTLNTVNGEPVCYLTDLCNASISVSDVNSEIGYLGLADACNVTLEDLNATIANNGQGVLLAFVNDSVITGITVLNNEIGMQLVNSSGNVIYHNSFINNTVQAVDDCVNAWDNGYPSGGNYWSDYRGVDQKSGPNQDQPGNDGIGDTPYIIDANNRDRYPLMVPWGTPYPYYDWIQSYHDSAHTSCSASTAPNTNNTLWEFTAEGGGGSPTVTDDTVFVARGGRVYALNETTGQLIWSKSMDTGIAATPEVAYGRVFMDTGYSTWGLYPQNVTALNETTGEFLWNYTIGGSLCGATPAEGMIFVGMGVPGYTSIGAVYALNATTGSLVWRYTAPGEVDSAPAVADGMVFCSSCVVGYTFALNMTTGAEIWMYPGWAIGSCTVVDGKVYKGTLDGTILVLDEHTGALISTITAGYSAYSAPIVAYGKVFVTWAYSTIGAFNETTGDLIWSWQWSPAQGATDISAADGKIFLATSYNDTIYAFNETNGQIIWKYEGKGGYQYTTAPTIADGKVFVTLGNTTYAFGAPSIARVVTSVEGRSAIVESNATLTSALVTQNTLSFYASGPSGSIGWSNVTFPMVNTTQITVFIDGSPLTPPPFPIITTNGTYYFIYFEFTLSTHEIAIQFGPADDVAVHNVMSSKTNVGKGYNLNINVTAADPGAYTETFNVTAYANTTTIATQTVTLTSGSSTTITFTWNTTGVPYGKYTIRAYAWPVPGEINTANNYFTGGWVVVTIPGDVDGDGYVGARDLGILGAAYNSYPGSSNWNPNADIDGEEYVGARDLGILGANYNKYV
jgi:parallel beta-helix repeat protein